jgi:hypothetical protein
MSKAVYIHKKQQLKTKDIFYIRDNFTRRFYLKDISPEGHFSKNKMQETFCTGDEKLEDISSRTF